jgi:hypothetical protein
MSVTIDKEVITLNLKMQLAELKERKLIQVIVKQVAEKWDKKKLTKRFADDVQQRLGDRYEVRYWHDKPFWRKLTVDKKNMHKFREEITLHHDSQGDIFSLTRFLDGGSHVGHTLQQINDFQYVLDNPSILDDLEGTLVTFDEQHTAFQKRMENYRPIVHLLNPDAMDFLRRFRG